MDTTTSQETSPMYYLITYTLDGDTNTATVKADSLDEADDAATELVARFARSGRHASIVSVDAR